MPNLHLTPPKNKNTASGYPDMQPKYRDVAAVLCYIHRSIFPACQEPTTPHPIGVDRQAGEIHPGNHE